MNKFEMKQLAYQSKLGSRALQVLLYLIDRANKEQTCFPAVPTIGRELHISISTVKRAMRELVEAGYVKKESRFREGNRGQTSNLYTLFFMEQEKGEDCARRIEPEQGNAGKPERKVEETMLGQRNVKESIAPESARVQHDVESKAENIAKWQQKKKAVVFLQHVDEGGGHFAIPLNYSLNRRQKVKRKYYSKYIRCVITRISELGQLRLSYLLHYLDIECSPKTANTA